MDHVTRKASGNFPFVAVMFPIGISAVSANNWSWWMIPALAVMLVLFVKVVPVCRHRENLWMFFLVMLTFALPNIHLLNWYFSTEGSEEIRVIQKYVMWMLGYIIMFSGEEIVMVLMTQVLFRNQYPMED